jgi:hypothetical protein
MTQPRLTNVTTKIRHKDERITTNKKDKSHSHYDTRFTHGGRGEGRKGERRKKRVKVRVRVRVRVESN